jgi:hypothetical protein
MYQCELCFFFLQKSAEEITPCLTAMSLAPIYNRRVLFVYFDTPITNRRERWTVEAASCGIDDAALRATLSS